MAINVVAFAALLSGGSQQTEQLYHNIILDGFSDRNYVELNREIGSPVCVYGRLSIDPPHQSVHFSLRPMQVGDIVTIGYSRINSGLSYEYTRRHGMVDGRRYRVCGTLRDATPFRQCDYNYCRWYRLENSELRLRRQN